MELTFLGTGAGVPSPERNVTSIALSLHEERGTMWMFDCGEGTQHQILRSPLKLSRLECIFITHLHGDHIFGLPGLLSSRSNQGSSTPLHIYGPPGLEAFVDTALKISSSRVNYALAIHEIEDGVIFEDDRFQVECGLLDHRIDSYGYRIVERDQPGTLLADKLLSAGVKPGPIYKQIKMSSEPVDYNGRLLDPGEYVGPDRRGRIIAIMGDTRPTLRAAELARDADVLVHEATFAEERAELAQAYFHSTARQAAEIASRARAETLIMTHISSRYQGDTAQVLLDEARRVHPSAYLAYDGYVFPIMRRS